MSDSRAVAVLAVLVIATVAMIALVLQLFAEVRALDDATETNLRETEQLRALVRECCAP